MSITPSPTATPEAQPAQPSSPEAPRNPDQTADTHDLIEADDLVEEISIDGMCGVY